MTDSLERDLIWLLKDRAESTQPPPVPLEHLRREGQAANHRKSRFVGSTARSLKGCSETSPRLACSAPVGYSPRLIPPREMSGHPQERLLPTAATTDP